MSIDPGSTQSGRRRSRRVYYTVSSRIPANTRCWVGKEDDTSKWLEQCHTIRRNSTPCVHADELYQIKSCRCMVLSTPASVSEHGDACKPRKDRLQSSGEPSTHLRFPLHDNTPRAPPSSFAKHPSSRYQQNKMSEHEATTASYAALVLQIVFHGSNIHAKPNLYISPDESDGPA